MSENERSSIRIFVCSCVCMCLWKRKYFHCRNRTIFHHLFSCDKNKTVIGYHTFRFVFLHGVRNCLSVQAAYDAMTLFGQSREHHTVLSVDCCSIILHHGFFVVLLFRRFEFYHYIVAATDKPRNHKCSAVSMQTTIITISHIICIIILLIYSQMFELPPGNLYI